MTVAIPTLEQCRSKHSTSVQRVNGQKPTDWTTPGLVYVGRNVRMFDKGIDWPRSGFGNPVKFGEWFTVDDKRNNLSTYIQWLDEQLNDVQDTILVDKFKSILTQASWHNIVFGCWCLNWDGSSESVPLCHACYFARAIDWLKMKKITQVCVDDRGVFYPNHEAPHTDVVVLRKPL